VKDIILIGGGGHCQSVIDTIESSNMYNIIGILDLPTKVGLKISGVEIIGTDEMLETYFNQGIKCAAITLGSIGDATQRKRLYNYAANIGFEFPTITDKTAIIGKDVKIEDGVFIGKGCIINVGSNIEKQAIINTGAIIEHDCRIGAFCHIGPGATLSGNVWVSEDAHIGTNSTIIQNIKIGNNSLIGAGSVIVRDVGSNMKAYGNPCKEV